MADIFPDFLTKPVDEVAQLLLGCELVRQLDEKIVRVRIVETESYDQNDTASHAYGGERVRNATMFKSAGHLYVYFIYGMHFSCNIVTGPVGYGSGVLIRAVEPVAKSNDDKTIQKLVQNRGGKTGLQITNGPGKLAQALAIDLTMDGHDLRNAPLQLVARQLLLGEVIVCSPRIGISKNIELLRRYYIKDNPYVSR